MVLSPSSPCSHLCIRLALFFRLVSYLRPVFPANLLINLHGYPFAIQSVAAAPFAAGNPVRFAGGDINATLTNSGQLNERFQGITYGNQIAFNATFSGPALNPSQPLPGSGSTFAISLYDATGNTPLLTTSDDGSLAHLDINPDGSISTMLFADSSGVMRLTITAVPEMGTVFSFTR